MLGAHRVIVGAAAALAAWFWAPPASATFYRIQTQTIGQAADLATARSWSEEPVFLERRRVTQYMSLGVYQFTGMKRLELAFESSFRFDSDFGVSGDARDHFAGTASDHFDLMWAYFDARDLGGWLDLRVGRQLITGPAVFQLFDGVVTGARLPFGAGARLLAGFAVRDDFALSPAALQPDGVTYRDDPSRHAFRPDIGLVTDSEPTDPAIVYGAGIFTHGFSRVDAQALYRRQVTLDGEVEDNLLGGSAVLRPVWGVELQAAADYSLVIGKLTHARAATAWAPGNPGEFLIGGEYLHTRPYFTADAIWNYFSISPFDAVRLQTQWRPVPELRLYFEPYLHYFRSSSPGSQDHADASDAPDPAPRDPGSFWSNGLQTGAAYRFAHALAGVNMHQQSGGGSRLSWLDISLEKYLHDDLITLGASANAAIFRHQPMASLRGAAFSISLWFGYQFSAWGRMRLTAERYDNPFFLNEYRALAQLDLDFTLDRSQLGPVLE